MSLLATWPMGPYDVILADPPWRYDFSRSKSRSVERRYTSMSVEEILALPVPELAHEHAVLYLWITAPKILEIGPALLAAWDFKAVTNRCWDKQRIGQGYWTRGEHEHLVIAKRGVVPPPPPSVRPRSMIREKRSSKHSQKPASVRDDITRAHPLERKIELFARDDDFKGKPAPRFVENWKPGWDAWGDQLHELRQDRSGT